MMYPTFEQVESADRFTICKWYRFLPTPNDVNKLKIMNKICEKYKEFGGFTPEISKQLGW